MDLNLNTFHLFHLFNDILLINIHLNILFQFADRVVVNFQCSIRLDIRDGECPVSIQKYVQSIHCQNLIQIPKCPDLSQQKPRLTRRSLAPAVEEGGENGGGFAEVDVRAPQIDIFDPEIGTGGVEG